MSTPVASPMRDEYDIKSERVPHLVGNEMRRLIILTTIILLTGCYGDARREVEACKERGGVPHKTSDMSMPLCFSKGAFV